MTLRGVVQDEAKYLWSDGRGPSLLVIATTWGLLGGARMILPVLLPYIRTSYNLSLTFAGLLVTVLYLSLSIGQFPSGLLADRYNESTLLMISPLLVAVALIFVITAPTTLALYTAVGVWGASISLYPVARITFLTRTYPERLGSALGVTMATGDIGQTVLPPVASILVIVSVWELGLGFLIPLLALLGLGLYLTLPRETQYTSGDETDSNPRIRDVFTEIFHPGVGSMAGILLLFLFLWQSFTAFYPTYLVSVKGMSPSVASLVFGVVFAVGIVIKLVAGVAYDKVGARISLASVLFPPIVGFLLLPFADGAMFLVPITAMIGMGLGAGAISQSYLAEVFGKKMRGTALGVIRTATATLAAAGPLAFGVIADNGFFSEGYVAMAVLMAGALLLSLRIPRQ